MQNGQKKLNPRSEADAQVTANRSASPLTCDVRSGCFIADHANLRPNNTIQKLPFSYEPRTNGEKTHRTRGESTS